MPRCHHLTNTAIAITILVGLPAIAKAQTSEPSTQASDLRIGPRVGVGANSPSSGTETNTRLETFLPIWQKPGQALTFFEGRLLLDDRANPGGNIIFGHRKYSDRLNRTFGGHLGFDIRNTDNSTFQQLGIGLESFGDDLDLHLNGYWPVGNTRRQVGQSFFNRALQLNGPPRFGGNALLLDLQEERRITRQFEEALAGVDFEVGTQLLSFKNGGELRAYVGPYFLHSGNRGNTFGGRLRLQLQPTRNISTGVGIQHDEFFGTHVLGSLTFTFPGNRPKGPIAAENQVVARMGSSVNRNNNVVVDTQTDVQIQVANRTVEAINPATGQPWFFNHVNLGLGNSDGTFESPFGTMAEALAATRGDGNDIVYVAQGTNPGIPAFTIPNNVQVLSRGPVQQIAVASIQSQLSPSNTLNLGTVQLPFSGTGTLPQVNGTVTMGNDTVLSGFDVNVDGGPALVVNNITSATVKDSTLTSTNSTTDGITIDGVTGTFNLSDTLVTITNPANNGITVANVDPTTGEVQINAKSGSKITGRGVVLGNNTTLSGFEINFTGAAIQASNVQNIRIKNNRTTNGTGIFLNNISGDIIVTDNFIEAGNDAIVTSLTDVAISNLDISGNEILALDGGGNFEDPMFIFVLGTTQIDRATISNNTITSDGFGDIGILLETSGTSRIQELAISNNTITTGPSNGILVNVNNSSQISNATFSNNTITSEADGIAFNVNSTGQMSNSTISGNTITATDDSIEILDSISNDLCFAITGNTSLGVPNNDLRVSNGNGGTLRIVDINNLSSNNPGFDDTDPAVLPVPGNIENGTPGSNGCPN
ncbi:hypothetical protein [Acaryochloris sp. IP29b_bin.148]|uniref:hypothetical protein n=1 Tax=Acaryochloris sp. IP29b_bin.148 TaxID=2969218 RepID=UPI0026066927|nr:hypothetical protein [Acaryochloris sp. IP29b_bin.148]